MQATAAFDTEDSDAATLLAEPAPPSCNFVMLSQIDLLSMLPHIVLQHAHVTQSSTGVRKWPHWVAYRTAIIVVVVVVIIIIIIITITITTMIIIIIIIITGQLVFLNHL